MNRYVPRVCDMVCSAKIWTSFDMNGVCKLFYSLGLYNFFSTFLYLLFSNVCLVMVWLGYGFHLSRANLDFYCDRTVRSG